MSKPGLSIACDTFFDAGVVGKERNWAVAVRQEVDLARVSRGPHWIKVVGVSSRDLLNARIAQVSDVNGSGCAATITLPGIETSAAAARKPGARRPASKNPRKPSAAARASGERRQLPS